MALVHYRFLADLRKRQDSNVVSTRLLGIPVIGIGGPDAAQLFYDEDRFERSTAVPGVLKKTLFGEGGVHVLDRQAHRQRKALFMRQMTPTALDRLEQITHRHWQDAIAGWAGRPNVVLFDEAALILTRAAVEWAGVPMPAAGAHALAKSLVALVDGFGSLGPRHVRARLARSRTELWARKVIGDIRDGRLAPPQHSVACQVALQPDAHGDPLPVEVAAVELLNFIRPTVAVAWFVAFTGHALLWHPVHEPRAFAQEVRRFYPFVPFLGARVREGFVWHGHEFSRGRLVLLDIYGTNHDPAVWQQPDSFDPQRFVGREPTAWDLIPQGGGDPHHGHRCPGEDASLRLTTQAATILSGLSYDVPDQDLSIRLDRIPTRPRDGFVIANVWELERAVSPSP